MKEIWKKIQAAPKYSISTFGRIRNDKTGYIIHQKPDKDGYLVALLKVDKPEGGMKSKRILVHRAMAIAFIPNPDNLPVTDHIDRNKLNNSLDNLRWVDYKKSNENRDGWKQKYSRIPVEQLDADGNVVAWYSSVGRASAVTGIHRQCIKNCCLGVAGHNTAGGYKWRYVEDERTDD